MSLDTLLDDLDSQYLDDYLEVDYTEFDDEGGFIDHTTNHLDGASVGSATESIDISTESIHQSPQVLFELPNGKLAQRELGDFLFVLDLSIGSTDTQRAMLTQAKFSKSSPSWSIDLYQYNLISDLPEFIVVQPQTFEMFDLDGVEETSFSNFAFAGHFDDPFYVTGERIEPGITNFNYTTDNSTFNRSLLSERIWPIEYTRSILKRFIRGTFGASFDHHSEIPRLVNHLQNISHDWFAPRISTDGGLNQPEEPPGFVLVNIRVSLEEEQYDVY